MVYNKEPYLTQLDYQHDLISYHFLPVSIASLYKEFCKWPCNILGYDAAHRIEKKCERTRVGKRVVFTLAAIFLYLLNTFYLKNGLINFIGICMIMYFIILWSNSSNMSITVVCKVLVIKTKFLDFLRHSRNCAQITILINLSAVKMPRTVVRSQYLVQPNRISNYWDADSESYHNLAK